MTNKKPDEPIVRINGLAAPCVRACAFLLEHGFKGRPSDAGSILVEARMNLARVQAGNLVAALRGAGLPVRPFSREAGDGVSIRVLFDPVAAMASIEVFGMTDELFPETPPKPAPA